MKKIILITVITLGLVGVFQAFGGTNLFADLTSSTIIESNQSFVLGEGKHGSYKAKITNNGNVDIEVFGELENEERKSLGVLKPKDKSEYNVAKNTKVIFKNLGSKTATIGIKLSGDTSLSMGYKPNKQ
jgi:nucleoid DNA-binding protein